MNHHPLPKEIRTALKAAANPEYAVSMQKYMKSEMPYYGVKSKQQKDIYKVSFKNHPPKNFNEYSSVIEELWDAEFREERYCAIRYAKRFKSFHVLEALPFFRMMIETGAWWDLVDTIAIDLIGALLRNFKAEMTEELKLWINDDHLWIRRTAILSQEKFKKDTDYDLLFDFCGRRLHEKSFWMRKAIGWTLREYSKHEPEKVREYIELNKDRMSGLTFREGSKYI